MKYIKAALGIGLSFVALAVGFVLLIAEMLDLVYDDEPWYLERATNLLLLIAIMLLIGQAWPQRRSRSERIVSSVIRTATQEAGRTGFMEQVLEEAAGWERQAVQDARPWTYWTHPDYPGHRFGLESAYHTALGNKEGDQPMPRDGSLS